MTDIVSGGELNSTRSRQRYATWLCSALVFGGHAASVRAGTNEAKSILSLSGSGDGDKVTKPRKTLSGSASRSPAPAVKSRRLHPTQWKTSQRMHRRTQDFTVDRFHRSGSRATFSKKGSKAQSRGTPDAEAQG